MIYSNRLHCLKTCYNTSRVERQSFAVSGSKELTKLYILHLFITLGCDIYLDSTYIYLDLLIFTYWFKIGIIYANTNTNTTTNTNPNTNTNTTTNTNPNTNTNNNTNTNTNTNTNPNTNTN